MFTLSTCLPPPPQPHPCRNRKHDHQPNQRTDGVGVHRGFGFFAEGGSGFGGGGGDFGGGGFCRREVELDGDFVQNEDGGGATGDGEGAGVGVERGGLNNRIGGGGEDGVQSEFHARVFGNGVGHFTGGGVEEDNDWVVMRGSLSFFYETVSERRLWRCFDITRPGYSPYIASAPR